MEIALHSSFLWHWVLVLSLVFWFASFPIATKAEYVVLQMRADLTAAHQARFCGREIASTRQQLRYWISILD